MSEQSTGAVAIWHDIVPEGLHEFYAWHGEEHMPERLAVPGFRTGRRFIAIEADLDFFNLYETATPDIVKGPEYTARLDNPTPRTLSAVRHFRNVARSLCRTVAQHGTVHGGTIATFRYNVVGGMDAAHMSEMQNSVLPDLARAAGVAAVKLLAADHDASGYASVEQKARGVANIIPSFALIIEGWGDDQAFMRFVQDSLVNDARRIPFIGAGHSLGFYRHQLTVVSWQDCT